MTQKRLAAEAEAQEKSGKKLNRVDVWIVGWLKDAPLTKYLIWLWSRTTA